MTSVRRVPRGAPLAVAAGFAILVSGFLFPNQPLPALPWMVRLADATVVFGTGLVAVLGAQDALLRRDGRSLPLAAASIAISVLWAVHYVVWPGVLPPYYGASSQVISAIFLTAHISTPTLLAIALAVRPGYRPRPGLDVVMSLVPAALGALILAGAAVTLAPYLPVLARPDGSITAWGRAADALAIPPAVVALALFATGRRGDERVAGGIAIAAALLIFNAVGVMLVAARYDPFFYIFNVLRVLPILALVGAQLGLHRHSIRHEQRMVRDLRLLHDAARAVTSSLELSETLEAIARAALDVFQLAPGDRVAIFQRDQGDLVALVRVDAEGKSSRDPLRFSIASHELFRHELATGTAATWHIEDAIRAGTPTAESLRAEGYVSFVNAPIPGPDGIIGILALATRQRREFDQESITLLDSLAQLAGLAMANAESFGRLAESESRLRTMFEGAGLPILVQDLEGRLVEVNPAACSLLGYGRTALLGRPAQDLVHTQDRARVRRFVANVLSGGHGIERWEMQVRGRDGSTVSVEVTAAPFPEPDGRPGLITMWLDLSERRRADKAARESREKSRFLATMSHELRTPLASVIGFAQLLESLRFGPLNPDQQRHVAHILDSGQHLLGLVDEVLDFSRIEAGRTEVSLGEVDLGLAVQQCLAELTPIAEEKHVELSHAAFERLTVISNRLRLRQVLFNLLSNAIKFTPPGGQVAVGVEVIGDTACVSVCDSGRGIPFDQQERIFDEFTQVDPMPGRPQGGTGLGLAVARRLAALMGGNLVVSSQPGLGSLFRLTQPLAPTAGRRRQRRRPGRDGLVVLQDPCGRFAGGAGLADVVAGELAAAEDYGYPVAIVALGVGDEAELPAGTRSGDIVVRVPQGPWLLVLPNCDLEGARELTRWVLSGLEPAPGLAGFASSEETSGERLLEVALAGMRAQSARAQAAG